MWTVRCGAAPQSADVLDLLLLPGDAGPDEPVAHLGEHPVEYLVASASLPITFFRRIVLTRK